MAHYTVANTAGLGNPVRVFGSDGVEIERCIDVDTDTGRIEAFVMDADGKPKLNEAGDAIERRVWIDQGVRIVWS